MYGIREYYCPERLDEALALILRADPPTAPLAGGTELLGTAGGEGPAAVVDLRRLGLAEVSAQGQDLVLGAMVTLETLARHAATCAVAGGVLAQGARAAAPRTLRRAATLGGTLAGRKGGDEVPTALLALDAKVVVYAPGRQELDLPAYWELAGRGVPHLITHVVLPGATAARRGGWAKVSRTPADRAIACAAAVWPAAGGVRVALGGVHPRPVRVASVEERIAQGQAGNQAAAVAGAPEYAATVADFRASAAYRTWVAPVLVRRALEQGLGEGVVAG